MTIREKVIARDKFGTKITIITYMEDGVRHYDFSTDGQRVYLTPALARKMAKALADWADLRELGN